MKNIVVFGKPRTFESYEFEFGERLVTKNENTHIEPYIKPICPKEAVVHYYVKENYICYEYYARANGFDSDRIGGVFGVGIKSDKDIKLFNAQKNVLLPFCEDLSNSFLYNNNSFNTQSIINQVSKTQWSEEEQEKIDDSIDNVPITKATKGLLLLVVSNFAEIANIESKIKEYSDVYIADNPDIFKDSNNGLYLKKSNNLIFTVEDGNFVPYKKAKKEESGRKGFVKEGYKGNEGDGSSEERKGFVRGGVYKGNDNSSGGDYDPPPPLPPTETWWQRHSKTVYAIVVTLIVVGIIFLILNGGFKSCSSTNSGNVSGDGRDTGSSGGAVEQIQNQENFVANSVQLASYDKPIEKELQLNPKPIRTDGNSTSTVSSEILLELSEKNANYAIIKDNILIVKNRPNTDVKVTVIAKLKSNGVELGRKEYIIAKKVEEKKETPKVETPKVETLTPASKIPKNFKGQERTIDQFITDLENTLKNEADKATWVQNECQKIINGDYGIEYKNNDKAIVLRDKAKNKASPAF